MSSALDLELGHSAGPAGEEPIGANTVFINPILATLCKELSCGFFADSGTFCEKWRLSIAGTR